MTDLLTALALILVIEGLIYAIFPGPMKSMMVVMLHQPADRIRIVGLLVAVVGVAGLWFLRG